MVERRPRGDERPHHLRVPEAGRGDEGGAVSCARSDLGGHAAENVVMVREPEGLLHDLLNGRGAPARA